MKDSKKELQKQMQKLASEIEKHDHEYYVLDEPSISDANYDELFRSLHFIITIWGAMDQEIMMEIANTR